MSYGTPRDEPMTFGSFARPSERFRPFALAAEMHALTSFNLACCCFTRTSMGRSVERPLLRRRTARMHLKSSLWPRKCPSCSSSRLPARKKSSTQGFPCRCGPGWGVVWIPLCSGVAGRVWPARQRVSEGIRCIDRWKGGVCACVYVLDWMHAWFSHWREHTIACLSLRQVTHSSSPAPDHLLGVPIGPGRRVFQLQGTQGGCCDSAWQACLCHVQQREQGC